MIEAFIAGFLGGLTATLLVVAAVAYKIKQKLKGTMVEGML